jgi:hypothetical protein
MEWTSPTKEPPCAKAQQRTALVNGAPTRLAAYILLVDTCQAYNFTIAVQYRTCVRCHMYG